jgi:hypothetical protein
MSSSRHSACLERLAFRRPFVELWLSLGDGVESSGGFGFWHDLIPSQNLNDALCLIAMTRPSALKSLKIEASIIIRFSTAKSCAMSNFDQIVASLSGI